MTVLYFAENTLFACWIIKATNPHSEYVKLIAFLRQLLLGEGASMLRFAYIAYLVCLLSGTVLLPLISKSVVS
jgi:hypothetical protein